MANNTSRNPEEVGRNKVRNMLLQSRALQNNCMQTKKKTTKKSLKHFLFLVYLLDQDIILSEGLLRHPLSNCRYCARRGKLEQDGIRSVAHGGSKKR